MYRCTDDCPETETTSHFLLKCQKYKEERKKLLEQLKEKNVNPSMKTLLTDEKALTDVKNYFAANERFSKIMEH